MLFAQAEMPELRGSYSDAQLNEIGDWLIALRHLEGEDQERFRQGVVAACRQNAGTGDRGHLPLGLEVGVRISVESSSDRHGITANRPAFALGVFAAVCAERFGVMPRIPIEQDNANQWRSVQNRLNTDDKSLFEAAFGYSAAIIDWSLDHIKATEIGSALGVQIAVTAGSGHELAAEAFRPAFALGIASNICARRQAQQAQPLAVAS